MKNLAYVVGDETTGEGAVVDPGAEADRILAEAARLGVRVTHVLLTHGHWDHIDGVPAVVKATGAKVAAHPANPARPDVPLADGEVLRLGGLEIRTYWTPGHVGDAV